MITPLRPHHTYKHANCLDAAIYVTKIEYRGPTYLKLKVLWVSLSGGIYGQDYIKIQRKDISRWKEIA